ncbi:glycosyltransferase family 4 protein [Haloarcula litorea]|uniref:glycosyltransferase family 4 protein n=1 Tax=Haloarcula litorea TaxID=3032579 RepID=UPI0023E8227A|nr:glycosyltransferase family 4 protein [Halomicroarcula sp. GDY20]
MKISILSPDLSENGLGRAYLLAQLLEQDYEVEIIGPELGGGIWEPVADEYKYKSVPMSKFAYNFVRKYPAISKQITGDVVYASKPRMTSFGWGLVHVVRERKPLVLDIDDWESGFYYDRDHARILSHIKYFPHLADLNSLNYNRVLERLSTYADELTVSNSFLQDKFGGTVIPHVRDTAAFNPGLYDKAALRAEFGLPADKQLVLFSGTPRPHKGLDDLITAMEQLERPDASLLIVGASDSDYVRELRSRAGDQVLFRGQQPFEDIPKWIAAADVFAIPQKDVFSTKGQLPAKLFDAMAMGKAIVATAVSDVPEILADAGMLVTPESPAELSSAIEMLLDDGDLRAEFERKARERCVEQYSYEAMAPRLTEVIEEAA